MDVLSNLPNYAMLAGAVVSALLAVASAILAPKQKDQRQRHTMMFLCIIGIMNALFIGLMILGLLRSKVLLWIIGPVVPIACLWFYIWNRRRQ